MKDKELEAFEKKHGYKPTSIPVACDALAVFVNKDNPIKGLTMAEVGTIFSSTGKCGAADEVKTWGGALAWMIPGRTVLCSYTDAIPYPGPMVTSRKKHCVRATLKTG